ncbi:TetR/AcrR family transcriptional regulator [Nocardioides dilutus]
MSWLADDRSRLATERILDAAGELFADRGPSKVSMGEVARAAGCSRATLYRYFSDRRELQLAYVHRVARRIGAAVTRETAAVEGREARLVAAVLSALRHVRGTPLLAGWLVGDGTAVTADIAASSEVLETLGMGLVDDPLAARWLLRVVVSLLLMPGRDEDDERELIERFVAPMLVTHV